LGDLIAVGAPVVITYQATDESGNTATCQFTVEVLDMQAPNAICKDYTVNLNGGGTVTITTANIDGGSTDNCPATLMLVAGKTSFDCTNVGDNTVTLKTGGGVYGANPAVVTLKGCTSRTSTFE